MLVNKKGPTPHPAKLDRPNIFQQCDAPPLEIDRQETKWPQYSYYYKTKSAVLR